ncbi:MAG: hypothetical protein RLY71_1723, partial [Pseudomonadota bacterium]
MSAPARQFHPILALTALTAALLLSGAPAS